MKVAFYTALLKSAWLLDESFWQSSWEALSLDFIEMMSLETDS